MNKMGLLSSLDLEEVPESISCAKWKDFVTTTETLGSKESVINKCSQVPADCVKSKYTVIYMVSKCDAIFAKGNYP